MDQGGVDLNTTFRKYRSVVCQGVNFKSEAIVYATLPPSPSYSPDAQPRPVYIDYFALHAFDGRQHLFAVVSWLKEHPDKHHFAKPLEVWWKDLVDSNLNVFVPVQLLICHSVYCEITYEEQTVYLLCPVRNIQ